MRIGFCSVIAGVLCFGATVQAAEINCGEDYVSKSGDTVYQVASKAFGPGLHRQLFVNVLMHRYGDHGGAVPEGTTISIPCVGEGGLILKEGFWSDAKPVPVTVTTVGFEQSAAGGAGAAFGIFNALIGGAFAEETLVPSYKQLSEADAAAFLPFADGAKGGDVSFPWFAADCAPDTGEAPRAGALCSAALWSDPFFEVTSSVYVSANASVKSLDRHARRGLCIADESRAATKRSRLFRASVVRDALRGDSARCLSALRRGEVSAAVVADFAAATDQRRNPKNAPKQVSGATFADTAHAVVAAGSPAATRILKRLNDGLAQIRTSGEWYRIVSAKLNEALLN